MSDTARPTAATSSSSGAAAAAAASAGLTKKHFAKQTVFAKEERAVIEARKASAREPFSRPGDTTDAGERFAGLQLSTAATDVMASSIDMPMQPALVAGASAAAVEAAEDAAFDAWLDEVYGAWPARRLNYFEHNVSVWRELWRVLALSDALCLLLDARAPLFHFPPSLYTHVVDTLGKPLVLVLTKVDLVAPATLAGWVNYFTSRFPGVSIVPVSTLPSAPLVRMADYRTDEAGRLLYRKRRKRKVKQRPPQGTAELVYALSKLDYPRPLNTDDWDAVINKLAAREASSLGSSEDNPSEDHASEDHASAASEDGLSEDGLSEEGETRDGAAQAGSDGGKLIAGRPRGSFVTIGMVGHPNVGKSALINALMGRHVVSVKRTPGHTKIVQTHFLAPSIQICDCPGLIFPKVDMPKSLQVLCGLYPTSQVVEPFSAVGYLAERIPLEVVLELQHPGEDSELDLPAPAPLPSFKAARKALDPRESALCSRLAKVTSKSRARYMAMHIERAREWAAQAPPGAFDPATVAYLLPSDSWSAWSICEAYALKRGFFTQNTGRPDVYRAAIKMIYDVLDGHIILSFLPPPEYAVEHGPELDAALKGVRHGYLLARNVLTYAYADDGPSARPPAHNGSDAGSHDDDDDDDDDDDSDDSSSGSLSPVQVSNPFAMLADLE